MVPLPLRKNTGSSKLSRPPPAALMENKTHKRTKKGKTDGADKKKSKKRKEKKKEAEEGCGGEFGCGEGKWSSSCKIRKYVKEQEFSEFHLRSR